MPRIDASQTQRLTREYLELTPRQSFNRGVVSALTGILLIAGSVAVFLHLEQRFVLPDRMVELEHDRSRLQDELNRLRIDLEMEQATKTELKRQVATLNDEVSELNHQLGFFNARGARVARQEPLSQSAGGP